MVYPFLPHSPPAADKHPRALTALKYLLFYALYHQRGHLSSLLVVTLGILTVCLFILKADVSRKWPKKLTAAILFLFAGCAAIFMNNNVSRGPKLQDGDIPFAIGVLRNLSLDYSDEEHAPVLTVDVYLHYMPGNFAMAVHYLSEDGKTIIAQDDFDLNLYLRNVIHHDPVRRDVWKNKGTLKIERTLAPPAEASFVRVSAYNPAGTESFSPQIRNVKNTLNLGHIPD